MLCSLVSVAMTKHHDQGNLGKEQFIGFIAPKEEDSIMMWGAWQQVVGTES